jgi:hypothetical protein
MSKDNTLLDNITIYDKVVLNFDGVPHKDVTI